MTYICSVSPGCALWRKLDLAEGIDVVSLFFLVCTLYIVYCILYIVYIVDCTLYVMYVLHIVHRVQNILFVSISFLSLSTGPETSEVILVSAAHCNFVCKVISNAIQMTILSKKGPRQQHCGDLLLPQSQAPRILPSDKFQWPPAELVLWKTTKSSCGRAIRIEYCL